MRKGGATTMSHPFVTFSFTRLSCVNRNLLGTDKKREQRLVLRNPLSEKALLLLVCSCLGETENGFIAMFPL